ncbi:sensor histidine kinase YesM [Dyadobacter sp. BE34]|uniref:Sensor histidine kinase YesM n=1 Tax=Dyadobacter fermentans TaxID=94254 RepID=A0ABU1R0X9_9BACT|nr:MULTISPECIES: histidine kinase [Dyadobacter]MDR6806559.1 sensor histidine kinase YesM [Dyadobacter fermentans]MDR7044300.1 sensor histidine kinase YesM [Dyadobacter sp. BE242]MDR7198611.1 sensor histidine kinase YesM [Dyadobacter sp. BE34]MDR7216573.1 sensor histidine kinase YesM [Dyadobacter sp. BE31]MDR7263901.1 sensor histidine kinase YesM [Dyadobacter sp. BE32]
MQSPRLAIWQQWLLHALLIWAGIEASDVLVYWYEVNTGGVYATNMDGSAVTQWQRFVNHNYYQAVWVVILAGTFIAEYNYHYVFKKKPFIYFVLGTCLFSAGFVVLLAARNQWKSGGQINFVWGPSSAFAAYCFCYALFRDFMHQRINKADRQMQQAQAELTTLRAQINPHFFFNTLNTLYGTALAENADKTAQCIEQLSNIMRYTVKGAQKDFTPVAQEISFLEDYLHLQQLRLPERDTIRVQTDLVYDGLPAHIAPFLLVPFVENAFRYGIRIDQDSFIKLALTVRDSTLDLSIQNSLFPLRSGQEGLGTGIQNTQKRLQLIYSGRHSLTFGEVAGQYNVRLRIRLH